jgi:KaiC/GvpD/RAD55 family RecA-like ATPase
MPFSSSDSIETFLNTIWRDKEGYVYLPTAGKEGDWKKTFFEWPKHKQHIVKHIERNSAEGREVYYSPAIYKTPSPKKESILGSYVLWVDFDGNAPEHWGQPDTPENGSSPSPASSEPSVRLQSSTPDRQHCYWVLDEFIESVPALEAMNRSLAYNLKADPSCWDATQLLRPPGTINNGYAKDRDKKYEVHIVDLSDTVYHSNIFVPTEDIRDQVKVALSETDIPPINEVITLRSWDKNFYELFNKDLRGTKGNRSDSLMALAYMGAESGCTDAEIYSIILDADTRWELYTKRTNRNFLLSDIITRARNKYPFSDPSEFSFLSGLDSGTTELAPKNDYGFGEILASEIKIDWLFSGLFSTRGYGLIYGTPGIGKTQLAIRMGMALATGTDFLGWKNSNKVPKRVYFFSLEMGMAEIKEFYEIMAGDLSDEAKAVLSENFRTNPIGEPIPLDRPEGRKYFEQSIKEAKAEVVLIDSYSDASVGSLSVDDNARAIHGYLQGVRKRLGIAVYIVHHDKKAQAADTKQITGTFDKMYGSRFLSAKADFVIGFLYAKKGHEQVLIIVEDKRRLSAKRTPFEIIRTDCLNFEETGGDNAGFGEEFGDLFNNGFGHS